MTANMSGRRPVKWALSLGVHVAAWAGVAPPSAAWGLHVGIFVVWLPTVFVSQELTRDFNRRDFLMAALRGAPAWTSRAALPPGLRDLYSTANGMVDGTMDPHSVNFWPIEKIVARSYVVESGPTAGIGFADVLINSWFLLLDVRASVLVVVNESTKRAQTLEHFWADYLDWPQSLTL